MGLHGNVEQGKREMGANHKQQKFYDSLACFFSSRPMPLGQHQLLPGRECWELMMTALSLLFGPDLAGSLLERRSCKLVVAGLTPEVFQAKSGNCPWTVVGV